MSQVCSKDYGLIPSVLRQSSDRRCRGLYSHPDVEGWKFCALGTLAHKAGENPIKIMWGIHNRKNVYKKYGVEYTEKPNFVKCNLCGAKCGKLSLIAHLNDMHDLEWGKIADILENTQPYDLTQPKINQTLDRIKIIINPKSNLQVKIFNTIEKRFRK